MPFSEVSAPAQTIGFLRLRKRDRPGGGGGERLPGHDPEARNRDAEEKLYCVNCGRLITRGRWRIAVGSDHEHTFFNPAGQVFRIGCFREAPGCRPTGDPSREFTWFKGYAWRVAACRDCGIQLGWLYTGGGPPPAFFGLILARLTGDAPTERSA